jgi:Tol biopolymer transport system component
MRNPFMRCLRLSIGTLMLATMGLSARAELVIEITKGVGQRTPVAVVPFGWEGSDGSAPRYAGVIAATSIAADDSRRSTKQACCKSRQQGWTSTLTTGRFSGPRR